MCSPKGRREVASDPNSRCASELKSQSKNFSRCWPATTSPSNFRADLENPPGTCSKRSTAIVPLARVSSSDLLDQSRRVLAACARTLPKLLATPTQTESRIRRTTCVRRLAVEALDFANELTYVFWIDGGISFSEAISLCGGSTQFEYGLAISRRPSNHIEDRLRFP